MVVVMEEDNRNVLVLVAVVVVEKHNRNVVVVMVVVEGKQ